MLRPIIKKCGQNNFSPDGTENGTDTILLPIKRDLGFEDIVFKNFYDSSFTVHIYITLALPMNVYDQFKLLGQTLVGQKS